MTEQAITADNPTPTDTSTVPLMIPVADLTPGQHVMLSGEPWEFRHREPTDSGHMIMLRRNGKVITRLTNTDTRLTQATDEQVAAADADARRADLLIDLRMLIDLIENGLLPVTAGTSLHMEWPLDTPEQVRKIAACVSTEVRDTYHDGQPAVFVSTEFGGPERPLAVRFTATNPARGKADQ